MITDTKASGVVLHISSLPSPYGIGTMGKAAYDFVDFLQKAGQQYWQILPLVPTGFGDSPYQSCSCAAGNPYFIDLEMLIEDGLLTREECDAVDYKMWCPDYVEFWQMYRVRFDVLRKAFERGFARYKREISSFARKNAEWLGDYTLYMACKTHFGMRSLYEWEDKALVARDPAALKRYAKECKEDVDFHTFLQYLFFKQWTALKKYANDHGLRIIGDLPIYVAADSAEVWARPELFRLDKKGRPSYVAGVPPDLYAETGQLWGNPLYDWKTHKADGYQWWMWRIEHARQFYDVIRIDHFRGFHTYWEVPARDKTAMGGKWKKGPGMDFVKTLRAAHPDLDIIAEDLGDIDEECRKFFDKTGYPGMKVLVYAFDGTEENPFLPANITPNSVAYTATHDSHTFTEWLMTNAEEVFRQQAIDELGLSAGEGYGWGAVRGVWESDAALAMAPLQDVLCLWGDARFNVPGTLGGNNWRWRVRHEAFNDEVAERLRRYTEQAGRLARK